MRIFGLLGVVIVLCAGFFCISARSRTPDGSPQEQIDTTAIRQRLLTIAQTERQYQATNGKYATLEQLAATTCCPAAPSSAATPSPRRDRDRLHDYRNANR